MACAQALDGRMEKLQLYSYSRSSCSWRVRIALNLKGLPYEYKPVNLLKDEQSSPEFTRLNPLGYVPVLADGDMVISDSFAILLYLEEKYPEHPILPSDTKKRALNLQSHRSWRRAFFVDRSSWKLSSLNAVEVPASVFRLQPIRAAVLLLGASLPRDPCRRLGICVVVFSVYGCPAPPLWKSSAPSSSAVAGVFLPLLPRSPQPLSPLLPVSLSCFPEKKGDMRA
ncbi:Glutathione S-transferase zeta class [Nymphaea thermarum]|nr:Glutathione S-transferase zeta class [Nymphaea thermarum]